MPTLVSAEIGPKIKLPTNSGVLDDRTLHELYLWPFADGIKAGVVSAMASYNDVSLVVTLLENGMMVKMLTSRP